MLDSKNTILCRTGDVVKRINDVREWIVKRVYLNEAETIYEIHSPKFYNGKVMRYFKNSDAGVNIFLSKKKG